MNDIRFIRDDVEEKKVKQLQEILDVLNVKPKDEEIEAAKRFFYSMLRAAQELAERKKEEAEKKAKIREIEQKMPPKPVEKPAEIPSILSQMPLEVPLPRPEEFKIPEEQPQAEEMIENIRKNYPLALFKNMKGEVITQTNMVYKNGKAEYELTEPEIDYRIVEETKKLMQKDFLKDKKIIKDEKFLIKNIKDAFKKLKIDYTEEYKEEIKYYLFRDMLGLGRIDPLIHDNNIKTIMCDGLNKPVKIALGPGLEIQTNIIYMKKDELDDQIRHLGVKIKNEASENNPVIEGMFYYFKIEATLGLGEAESKFVIKRMP
ncbi:MAG: hypothetical protein Q8N77_02945 [Nanoarchaeota archaeon]|nr:hypothetical protein [Nanoarchaeota archaeon]